MPYRRGRWTPATAHPPCINVPCQPGARAGFAWLLTGRSKLRVIQLTSLHRRSCLGTRAGIGHGVEHAPHASQASSIALILFLDWLTLRPRPWWYLLSHCSLLFIYHLLCSALQVPHSFLSSPYQPPSTPLPSPVSPLPHCSSNRHHV